MWTRKTWASRVKVPKNQNPHTLDKFGEEILKIDEELAWNLERISCSWKGFLFLKMKNEEK